MKPEGSVTQYLPLLRAGDAEAARRVWGRYFGRLVRLAERRIRGLPGWRADGEDLALSAFKSFCEALRAGQFRQLADRDDLWAVLAVLLRRKACDHARRLGRARRGGGRNHVRPDDEQIQDPAPGPELQALMAEECRRLLEGLGEPSLQQVALLKLEGHTDREVAARLGCGLRTVERKLELIRRTWQQGAGA